MLIKKHLRRREPLLSVRFQMVSCLFLYLLNTKKNETSDEILGCRSVYCVVYLFKSTVWNLTCLCDNRFQGFLNYWPLWGNIYLGHLDRSNAINPEESFNPKTKNSLNLMIDSKHVLQRRSIQTAIWQSVDKIRQTWKKMKNRKC